MKGTWRHTCPLRTDLVTGLSCCWVCEQPMDPVLARCGYVSHPDCDPREVVPAWPPDPVLAARYGKRVTAGA